MIHRGDLGTGGAHRAIRPRCAEGARSLRPGVDQRTHRYRLVKHSRLKTKALNLVTTVSDSIR